MLEWPLDSRLHLSFPTPTSSTIITMLGVEASVFWEYPNDSTAGQDGMTIQLSSLTPNLLPCSYAWVLVMTGIGNLDAAETNDIAPMW
jgi:hypothetical protein